MILVLRNVVPRQGTETASLHAFLRPEEILRNVVPQQGTETINPSSKNKAIIQLRNVVPRQGTETQVRFWLTLYGRFIEKCSSPTGTEISIHLFEHRTINFIDNM